MTVRDVELSMQRMATAQYISAKPKTIVLHSRARTMVNGTMKTANTGVRAPQIFRLVWLSEDGIHERPPEGSRKFDFAIIGNYDAEVAIGDFWKEGDQEFVVENITPSNGWEVKAYGISHGSKPN